MQVRETVLSHAEMLYTVPGKMEHVVGGCEDSYAVYSDVETEVAVVLPADHAARADKRYGAGLEFALLVAFNISKQPPKQARGSKRGKAPKVGPDANNFDRHALNADAF